MPVRGQPFTRRDPPPTPPPFPLCLFSLSFCKSIYVSRITLLPISISFLFSFVFSYSSSIFVFLVICRRLSFESSYVHLLSKFNTETPRCSRFPVFYFYTRFKIHLHGIFDLCFFSWKAPSWLIPTLKYFRKEFRNRRDIWIKRSFLV